MEIVMLSWRKGSWNGNHDAFPEERIMERETIAFSCKKGSWIEKTGSFPSGKNRGGKIHEFRPVTEHVWFQMRLPEPVSGPKIVQNRKHFFARNTLCVLNLSRLRNFLLSIFCFQVFLLNIGR